MLGGFFDELKIIYTKAFLSSCHLPAAAANMIYIYPVCGAMESNNGHLCAVTTNSNM